MTAGSQPSVCCVVPCYNVAPVCRRVVRDAARHADRVIAVNDGSTDGTDAELRGAARECKNVSVLRFPQNRGKGVALLAAFRHALEILPFDLLVTLDGDGQHRPEDIPRLVSATTAAGAEIVIGQRQEPAIMPWRSRVGNQLTTALLRWSYPEAPADTQSGMRALDRNFVAEIVRRIPGRRYETELQILLLALEQRRCIATVPIPTIYFQNNRLSHFRPILDSWRIYQALLRWQFSAPRLAR